MKKLDRFILREIISDGAAGTVYLADETLPGEHKRAVALKVLPVLAEGDEVGRERFFNEVGVLAQLSVQPHVVTIYAMGISTEGYPWLAMEYAAGTVAAQMADEPGDVGVVRRLIRHVAAGLHAMHGLQPPLIHQDLKPANILDAAGVFKVTDFSLATVVAANRTHGLATVRYAAPELLSAEFGRVGPATDLYSLGHIAYEMALGQRLHRQQFKAVFEGNPTKDPPPNKWMMWHASGNIMPAPAANVRKGFPAGLSQMIERLMAKPQAQRYVSAEEVLRELESLGDENAAPVAAAPGPANFRGSVAPPPLPTPPAPAAEPEAAPETAAPAPLAGELPRQVPKTAASAAANVRYWVRLRGRVTGPFDTAALQRQIRQGQLSRLHQVSPDQITWKAASEIEGLYGPTVV